MHEIPADRRYTDEHEWVRGPDEEGLVTIGITAFAQDQLGDVVYVELPSAGADLEAAQPFGVVESVKAASDLYAPVSGVVVEANKALDDKPELVNDSPYEDGWMLRLKPREVADVDALMDAQAYRELLSDQD